MMSESMRSILLVDGNREAREGLAVMLRKHIGCVVLECQSPAEALEALQDQAISLVITDLFGPRHGGIDLLKQVRADHPQVAVIVSVPYGDRDSVVEALRRGAIFYIHSPYDFEEAVIATARALEHRDLLVHQQKRSPKISKSDGFYGIIGQSPKMLRLFSILEKVAEDGESNVLIHGESGTGKELVARATHAYSPRKGKNFVPVNCAAIPDELLESELFGYVKGAFTGANQSKIGRIQYADGGTLFLDEIGDLSQSSQIKLLRLLQEREYLPLGSDIARRTDCRMVFATHQQLDRLRDAGSFRKDLFYRLHAHHLHIPPLRERRDDLPLLVEQFLAEAAERLHKKKPAYPKELIALLNTYHFPGNIRELRNMIFDALSKHKSHLLSMESFKEYLGHQLPPGPGEDAVPAVPAETPFALFPTLPTLKEAGNLLVQEALRRASGNQAIAADLLGITRQALNWRLKQAEREEGSETT